MCVRSADSSTTTKIGQKSRRIQSSWPGVRVAGSRLDGLFVLRRLFKQPGAARNRTRERLQASRGVEALIKAEAMHLGILILSVIERHPDLTWYTPVPSKTQSADVQAIVGKIFSSNEATEKEVFAKGEIRS